MLTILGLSAAVSSCNAKEENEGNKDNYVTTQSVAVTAFSLSADLKIMKNLDSVFFSIDLEHGVIFNADSLPKGTNITKLVPKISYPSSVTTATIEMTGGTHREGTTNYISTPNDTIDFTGDVKLTLCTAKDAVSKTYTLKVNVHNSDPDTIFWDRMASMTLPSRLTAPEEQKTVEYGGAVVCLIRESDDSYTLSRCEDIFEGSWTKTAVRFDFTPSLHSLTSSENCLYLLGENGTLYSSADGTSWSPADSDWTEIIGMYGDTLLGTSLNGTAQTMKSWPSGNYPEIQMPDNFPLYGFTSPIEFTNRWTPDPTIVIFGGYPFASNGKSPAWAFDGNEWVNIAENALPALTGMSVVDYYSYLKSATNGLLKEFEVYLAFGGKDETGSVNNTVYVSYDHGINWQRAQEYTQLPPNVTAGFMVDALTLGTTLESNLSNRWKKEAKRRLPFEIEGDLIKWTCPYIFLFGGMDEQGVLNTVIRSGVLERLTYEPLF